MKRYLVFIYSRYYPSGGMFDFEGDFETVDEAINRVKNHDGVKDNDGLTLHHIYDSVLKDYIEYEIKG